MKLLFQKIGALKKQLDTRTRQKYRIKLFDQKFLHLETLFTEGSIEEHTQWRVSSNCHPIPVFEGYILHFIFPSHTFPSPRHSLQVIIKRMIPLLLLLLPGVSARGEKRIPSTVRLPPPRRTSDAPLGSVPCPCSSSALCSPVSGIPDREIFGFGSGGWNVTGEFDFDTLTTVAWGEGGGEFVCKAHANNVSAM